MDLKKRGWVGGKQDLWESCTRSKNKSSNNMSGRRDRLAILSPGWVKAARTEGGTDWRLLAHVDPLCVTTLLAQHVTTPVKSAIAALAACLFEDVVSTAAAQRAAAVCAVASFVADSSVCSRRVYGHVVLTKVRRLLKVHQLSGHDSTTPSAETPLGSAGTVFCPRVENPIILVLRVDKNGCQELFFEYGAHKTELWRHMPAGLKLTAPWCAVTFAFPCHVVSHYLCKE